MRWFVMTILFVLLAGCTPVSEVEPALGGSDPAPEPSTPATVEVLTFEGNGDTFLAHIGSVAREQGKPERHTLVEVITADGMAWQGEALHYGDSQTVLLQQAQAGGDTAISLEVAIEADLAAILAEEELPVDQPLYSAHPQIQLVRARLGGDGAWTFDVTLTYPDTGWEDYADGWHVATPEGDILGTRVLLHPHVGEQPFTRSLSGVAIADDVTEVIVRSHNLVSGYAPETVRVPIAESGEGNGYEVVR